MKYTHKIIAELIKRTAKELGKNPHEINKSQLLKADTNLTDWTLRGLGGLQAIKERFFPVTTKDLVEISETKDVNLYIKQLEAKVATKESFQQKLLLSVQSSLKPLPKIVPKKFKPSSIEQERQIVLMLNDTHFGLIVHSDEVNEVNSFGWTQACRRTAMMLKETLNYKVHNRNQVSKVHLILNGDLIQGVIHGLQMDQMEKSIYQVNGAVHILTHLIAGLAQEFKEVEVHGICGNHEDALHKRDHGKRVASEKYDSYANIIFYALSAGFRLSDQVKFNFTKGLHLSIDLPAGRALVAHGDTLFSRALGNPGTVLNVKALSGAIREWNAGELAKGRPPAKLLLFGHVHSYASFITPDGVMVYIAPSLSGTDGYSHGSFNANTNITGQVVFESTPKFIMGDSRLVRLNDADNDSNLDSLIPVYKNSLKWSK
jgi:hypothetical protein